MFGLFHRAEAGYNDLPRRSCGALRGTSYVPYPPSDGSVAGDCSAARRACLRRTRRGGALARPAAQPRRPSDPAPPRRPPGPRRLLLEPLQELFAALDPLEGLLAPGSPKPVAFHDSIVPAAELIQIVADLLGLGIAEVLAKVSNSISLAKLTSQFSMISAYCASLCARKPRDDLASSSARQRADGQEMIVAA